MARGGGGMDPAQKGSITRSPMSYEKANGCCVAFGAGAGYLG